MTFQTSYATSLTAGKAGLVADYSNPLNRDSGIAEVAIGVGLAVVRGTAGRQMKAITAVATDVDSILASGGASAGTAQTIVTTALNGVIGQGRIVPAQQVTLTLDSHADWDATVMQVRGEDADGNAITEDVLIPNGGAATITTIQAFGRVTALYIPAQTGATGTFTAGTIATKAEYSRRDFVGIAEWQGAHMPYEVATYAAGEYSIGHDFPVVTKGRIWAITEGTTLRGDNVYVRIVVSGGDTVGQFSSVASSGFALVRDAKFHTAAAADGVAQIQL
jgi:hypothetical protein